MSDDSGVLKELEPIREELEAWRVNSGRGSKIPPAVWDKATVLAKKYSVQAVSKGLHLSYSDLKQHVTGVKARQHQASGMTPTFIEVKPATPLATASASEELGCIIELTKSSGARMRISLKSAGAVDWCRIKEAFLGA
jgi:hypothetical protein